VTQTIDTLWEITLATLTITTGGAITVTDGRSYCYMPTLVTTENLDADCVDDTIVGNRVPALTKRQGGDATAWAAAGTTDYTPTTIRMQCGVKSHAHAGVASGYVDIFFFPAFSATPIVVARLIGSNVSTELITLATYTIAEYCQVRWATADGGASEAASTEFAWWAIGPE
jgi:hypothetical protein